MFYIFSDCPTALQHLWKYLLFGNCTESNSKKIFFGLDRSFENIDFSESEKRLHILLVT